MAGSRVLVTAAITSLWNWISRWRNARSNSAPCRALSRWMTAFSSAALLSPAGGGGADRCALVAGGRSRGNAELLGQIAALLADHGVIAGQHGAELTDILRLPAPRG